MRAILLSLFLKLLAPQAATDLAVLEGRLLHLGTSEPIPDAQISIARLNPNMPQTPEAMALTLSVASLTMRSPQANAPGYIDGFLKPAAEIVGVSPDLIRPLEQTGVVTDASGNFRFENLRPGRYALSASRDGYYGPRLVHNNGSTLYAVVTIEAGKQPPRLNLFMKRGGVIAGRVRGPQGEPVSGIQVTAFDTIYPNGRAEWGTEALKITDDRGEFRLGPLPPGEYFIGTVASVRKPAKWTDTYYPGVANPSLATALVVTDSAELTGIDLNVTLSNTPTFRISGTSINTLAPTNNSGVVDQSIASFILVPREASLTESRLTVTNAIPVGARPNGEFQIRDVKPGSYDLYALAPNIVSRSKTTTVRTPVTVRDADVAGVSMILGSNTQFDAEVVVEGGAPVQMKPESLSLRLEPADSLPTAVLSYVGSLRFDSTGKVAMETLPAARYTLSLMGLPESAYVSDIHQSGRSVYNDSIVVGSQPDPVRIVVRLDGATVTGVVRTGDRKPAGSANVILVPTESRRGNPLAYKTAVTDEEGRFSITGVAPGGYSVFALQSQPYGQPWLNAAFLARYQDRARAMSTAAQSTVSIELELVADRF